MSGLIVKMFSLRALTPRFLQNSRLIPSEPAQTSAQPLQIQSRPVKPRQPPKTFFVLPTLTPDQPPRSAYAASTDGNCPRYRNRSSNRAFRNRSSSFVR